MSAAASIALALKGRRSGHQWVVRCPAHEDHDPSLSLRDGECGLLVHCFAGCDPLAVLTELRRRGLVADLQYDRQPSRSASPRRPVVTSTDGTEAIGQLRERAAAILRRAIPIKGTPAERYLIGRGLEPAIVDPLALRFLPAREKYPPAMLALITDFREAVERLGLQITSLHPDGTKIDRKFMRGTRPKGGVIRLIEDAEVTTELGLAEGTETALAVMTAMRRAGRTVLPMWAALSAGTLANLPILSGIERLFIHADRDESGTGQRAAETLAQRWVDAGRQAFIRLPAQGDWNE